MSETRRRVLKALSRGEFVTGAAIGRSLDISRTAVWKHLNQLEEWGVPIVKNRQGYRLHEDVELLSKAGILAAMAPHSRRMLKELLIVDRVDSTNTLVRNRLAETAGSGFVCLAEQQTQGRGRLGRSWVSPFGRNIYLSVGWEYEGGAAVLEGLSLAVGVAICDAIKGLGVVDVALKWPNDILLEGRKTGGVLLEMTGDPVGRCQVIVGIGINFAMPPDAEIDQPWADLSGAAGMTRNLLTGAVLSELMPLLRDFQSRGFRHYREAWERFNAHRGQRVRLTVGREVVEGILCGVSDNGAVVLQTEGRQRAYSGGEISLRGLE